MNLENLKLKSKEICGSQLMKDLQAVMFLLIVVGLFYLFITSGKQGLTPTGVIGPLEHESVMDRK